MTKIMAQLVKAIEESAETRYAIAKGSGVAQSQISRLMSGERVVGFEAAERLADHLGFEIVLRPKRNAQRAK